MSILDEEQIESNDSENSENNVDNNFPLKTNINPNAPDFIKDIKKSPLEVDMEYVPQNPYTLGLDGKFNYHSDYLDDGIKQKSSFIATAKAEAYNFNFTAQGIHGAYDLARSNPIEDLPDADWNSKKDTQMFLNVEPKNLPYMFAATGPKDQAYRLERVLAEQKHDETLANGSFLAKLLGGAIGMVTDPMSYIPIVGWAKYAKLGSTFGKSLVEALPGATRYGVYSSAAEQMDKVNGNLQDFLKDSFVRTTFAGVLFGGIGVGAVGIERMGLWGLRDIAKGHIDGMDFKFALNEEGKISGIKATDSTGSLSAADVSYYQDLADSSFSKMGVFKVPYLGAGIEKFVGMPIIGSPLLGLYNSSSMVVRGVIDRVSNSTFITKGVAEGKSAPQNFKNLQMQTDAKLSSLQAQMISLHLSRNGFDIKSPVLGGVVDVGLNLKQKSLELLQKDLGKNEYKDKFGFYSEIEQVLFSKVASEHSAVNEAANLLRPHIDETYSNLRKAYNLPEDWAPPKHAAGFLMRVYDTPFLNVNEDKWIGVISKYLADADITIAERLKPIKDQELRIKSAIAHKESLNKMVNVSDQIHKEAAEAIISAKSHKKILEESLQDELRINDDLQLHVEDWNALSATEAKEIVTLTKRQKIALKEVDKYKAIVDGIKAEAGKRSNAAIKAKTAKTAKSNTRKSETGKLVLAQEEEKLAIAEKEYSEETEKLQEMMHNGKINSRLFTKKPDSFVYEFRDPNNRLKFRDVYPEGSIEKPNIHRENHAKAYYDTIMNQTAEDTINDVMGKYTGSSSENPLKSRSINVPDELLYNNKFMSKDLMSKVANYTKFLDRRTHLKTVFNDVTLDGGFEPLIKELSAEHLKDRARFSNRKEKINEKLEKKDITEIDKKKFEKQLARVDKEIVKNKKNFDKNKKTLNFLYENMMGIQRISNTALQVKSGLMSFVAWAGLANLPFAMINDLGSQGLKQGVMPWLKDGIYPLVESLGGILKTKDSAAFRESCKAINLGFQTVNMSYARRNWEQSTNPYLNLGKIVSGLEWVAHSSANFTLTNAIDNLMQKTTSSIVQGNLMSILHDFAKGTMSKRDGLYIRKYGIDPAVWAPRMIEAFNKSGGGKTKVGGYLSNFWKWEDMEAANKFSDAVFRSVKDTHIQAGIADSPLWTDDNGPLGVIGSIVKGFNGWMFASLNRYLIPVLQQPDAENLIGVMFMMATGALVSPTRRMARGLDPYPEDMTTEQWWYQTIQDSGIFSYPMNAVTDMNLISSNRLLGDLKNDRYTDRLRTGFLGPAYGKANQLADVIGAAATGEWNKADMNTAARMLPWANASWGQQISKKITDSLDFPQTRSAARAANE